MGSADAGPTRDRRSDHGDTTIPWVGRSASACGARCRRCVGTTCFARGDAWRHLAVVGRATGAATDGTRAGAGSNCPGSDVGKPNVVPAAQCRSDMGIARGIAGGRAGAVVGCSAARARSRTRPAGPGMGSATRRVGCAFMESSACGAVVGAAARGSSGAGTRWLGCARSGRASRAARSGFRSTPDGRPLMGRSGRIDVRATARRSGSCLGGAPNRGARRARRSLMGGSGRSGSSRSAAAGRSRSAVERPCASVVGGSAAGAIDRLRTCGGRASGPGRGARRGSASPRGPVRSPTGAGALGPAINSGFIGRGGDDDRATARRHRDGP